MLACGCYELCSKLFGNTNQEPVGNSSAVAQGVGVSKPILSDCLAWYKKRKNTCRAIGF